MCQRSSLFALLLFACASFAHAQTCPNPAATPLAPADNSDNVPTTVTFQWSAVPGAQGYEVWAQLNGQGDFVELTGTSDTSDIEDIDPDTQVEWYVVTNFDSCKTQSAHFHFHTSLCGSSTATPLDPPNGAFSVNSPVTFSWAEASGAGSYRVWLSQNGEDFDALDETDQTSLTWRVPPGNYAWFVESFFDSCPSTDSDTFTFTIPRSVNCPTTGPTIVSPAEGSTSTSAVHFAWSATSGAIGYEVWAALDDGEFELVGDTNGETSLDADIGFGQVTWYVVAQFGGCDDLQSADAHFAIPYDPNCDHNATLLISPADGINKVPTTTQFIWTPVDGASGYRVWAAYGNADPVVIGTTTSARFTAANLQPNAQVNWFIETTYASCPSDVSPQNGFTTGAASQGCPPPAAPDVYIDSEAMSGDPYSIIFDPGLNTASYQIVESTDPTFANAQVITSSDVLLTLSKTVAVATRFYYRVRSFSSCSSALGPFSPSVSVVVLPSTTTSDNAAAATSYGSQNPVVQTIHISGSGGPAVSGKTRMAAGQTFSITTDKPWLSVTPSSGTIPPQGLDIKVTADPKTLPVGTSSGTIRLSTTAADAPTSVPVSVNLVTPVTPNPGNTPLPTSLIIPAVAHVAGAGTNFQSDIRVTNASAQSMKYQLNFTPTRSDGTKVGQQSTITIDPGETAALNDIMKNFFGFAAAGDQVAGVLEIRPMSNNGSSTAPNVTFASSRTFAVGPTGTYGQFVPAIPFSQFIGKPKSGAAPFVSLQQVAQSSLYRTNVGLVEAAGEPATVQLDVFAHDGSKVASFPITLQPGEHQQFPLSAYVPSLDDGRVQVSVTSPTGKVTAYASVLDNKTNDPMLILPVNPATVSANRYVLPGVGDVTAGSGRWRSDVRLFNGGSSDAQVTITYYKLAAADPSASKTITIAAGQVQVLDAALQSLFGISGEFGSFVVTTPANSSVVATARTYFDTGNGTFGQFIPGLTPADGAALGSRALQILQLESSDNFHTNVGLVELTGNPVTVELSATTADSKVAAKAQFDLQGNQYIQINDILKSKFAFGTTYNARISVKVIAGTGRVSGYASLIDNRTLDPTYVPAQ